MVILCRVLTVSLPAPVVDDGAVEYVEYTFPFFDVDEGQELWNNKPSYELDVRWFESYSKCTEEKGPFTIFSTWRTTSAYA